MKNNAISQYFKKSNNSAINSDSELLSLSTSEIIKHSDGNQYKKVSQNVFDKVDMSNVFGLKSEEIVSISDSNSTGVTEFTKGDGSKGSFKCHVGKTNNNPTLSWGQTSTIGTIDGTEFKVTMPSFSDNDTTYTLERVDTNSIQLKDSKSQVQGKITFQGSGSTTVTSNSNTITISSTNTTYNNATQSSNGLMSSSDKIKLDGITLDKYLTYTPRYGDRFYKLEYKTKQTSIPHSDGNGTYYEEDGWYVIGYDKTLSTQVSHELLSNSEVTSDVVQNQSGFVPKVGMIRQCYVNNWGKGITPSNDSSIRIFRAGDTTSGRNLFLCNYSFQIDDDDKQWSYVQKMDGTDCIYSASYNKVVNNPDVYSIDNTKYTTTWVALSPIRTSGDWNSSSGLFMCISVSSQSSGGSTGGSSSSGGSSDVEPTKKKGTWNYSWQPVQNEEALTQKGYTTTLRSTTNDGIGSALEDLRNLTGRKIESSSDIITFEYLSVSSSTYGAGGRFLHYAEYYYTE